MKLYVAAAAAVGSSPPVRGTLAAYSPKSAISRFIPACAGNTSCNVFSSARFSVHPRLCGEHFCAICANTLFPGSSPPVRGTLPTSRRRRLNLRFIPACAGNTASTPTPPPPYAVHPRLCGEHDSLSAQHGKSGGSSPPVRGTRICVSPRRVSTRFIPACAGNTYVDRLPREPQPVHPRLCGEHCRACFCNRFNAGSSPPVRGTPARRSDRSF